MASVAPMLLARVQLDQYNPQRYKVRDTVDRMAQNFANVFPEGLSTLHQADPEVFSIIKDEEERQWCAMLLCNARRM